MTVYTLETALQRIAELEAELATRPAKRASRKTGVFPECQYCRDTKTEKVTFLGLPLCADWKPCAARQRRAKGNDAFAWDKRYRTRPTVQRDGRWIARFNDEILGVAGTQAEGRQLAHAHWQRQERGNAVAA